MHVSAHTLKVLAHIITTFCIQFNEIQFPVYLTKPQLYSPHLSILIVLLHVLKKETPTFVVTDK